MDKLQILRNIANISHLCGDVWLEIFQYFAVIELFSTFENITNTSDEVLFNRKFRNQLRGLVIDSRIINLPKGLALEQVISLTMQNGTSFDIIQKSCCLRSLKLVGESEWIISLIRKCSHKSIKFEQLSIVIPDIKPLYQLLSWILSLDSLRRLEICAEEQEERIEISTLSMAPSKIEQLVLHSCSAITYSDLACIQPGFMHVRYLNISLFQHNRVSVGPFIFPYLRSLRVSLLEVPFEEINRLVATMPRLVKLKLSGLADDENYIDSHKWLHLLRSVPALLWIAVDISLQQSNTIFYCEQIPMTLQKINMSLTAMIDDYDCYSYKERQQHWWQLKGIIRKQYCERN